jgi:O-antigen/teichoic acid export membrane protein
MGLDPNQIFSISKIAIGNVSAQAFRFLFWLSAVWILTPDEYGLIRYSLTIANFLSLPVLTGFSAAITKFISEHKNTRNINLYIINTIVFDIVILISLVFLAVLLGISFPNQIPLLSTYILIVLGFYAIYYAYVRGLMDVNRIVAFTVSVNLLRVVFIFIFFVLNLFGILWALVAFGLPLIFGWGISELFRGDSPVIFRNTPSLDLKVWKEILYFAVPGFVAGSLWMFIGQIDIIFIKAYLTLADVAYYSLAKSLASTIGFVTGAIIVLHMPKISSFKKNKNIIYSYTKKSLKVAIYGSLILSLLLYSSSPFIFRFFPKSYENSLISFYILIPATFFSGLFGIVGATWIGYGKPEKEAQISALILPVIVVLNFILVPSLSIAGAAISYLISEFLMFIFIYISFIKNFFEN